MVSIIIPIYNAAKYIEQGFANVLAQTYTDWELIFVDDGSQDDSATILNRIAAKDERVRLLHQQNAGPGIARNVGIETARGEWIYFYDADDIINDMLLQKCVEQGESNQADLVVFGFDAYDQCIEKHTYSLFESCVCRTNHEIGRVWTNMIKQSVIGNGFPWNKFYRRSFLLRNHLCFGKERVMEDELFNLRVFRVANSMVVMNDIFYTYFCNNAGNSRTKYISNRFEIVTDVRKEMFESVDFWHINNDWINKYIERRYWLGIKRCLLEDMNHTDNPLNKDKRKQRTRGICQAAEVRDCLSKLRKWEVGFEDSIYADAIEANNLCKLKTWGYIFKILRSINNLRK